MTALELAAGLQEFSLSGLRGRHAGDVEELEVANVVPGEDRVGSGNLVEQGCAGGESGGLGEGGLRIAQTAEEAGVGEDGVLVGGEPGLALSGVGPAMQERREVGRLDG